MEKSISLKGLNPREGRLLHKLDRRKLRQPHYRTLAEMKIIIKVHYFSILKLYAKCSILRLS